MSTKTSFLHIQSCAYPAACPQLSCFQAPSDRFLLAKQVLKQCFGVWRSASSDVQSCWQLGSVLSRPDFSLARIAIMVVDLVSFPSVRRNGQSGQIQTRTNGPDNFFSSFNKRVSIGSFFVVDAEGVCATSCQTFLQQRTRQRMQYPGPFFFGFSPALAHFIFLISR